MKIASLFARCFDFNDRPVLPSALVARRAVLWPLAQAGGLCRPDASAASECVLRIWRKRLEDLSEAGCQLLSSCVKKHLRCYNCCPSMIHTNQFHSLVCRRDNICPWCWGRRIQSFCEQAGLNDAQRFAALFGDGAELSIVTSEDFVPVNSGLLRDTLKYGADVCHFMTSRRPKPFRASYWVVTAEPVSEEKYQSSERGFLVRTAFFGVRTPDMRLTIIPKQCTSFNVSAPLTPEVVGNHIRHVTAYPVGLLTGDPDLTCRILGARQDVRLTETTGSFRGTHASGTVGAFNRP